MNKMFELPRISMAVKVMLNFLMNIWL
jgi:hypothetical protein